MKYSVLLLLLMIVACSVPESDASSHYYTSYDSLNGTTWETSDKKVKVVINGNTASVTYNSRQTYNLQYSGQQGNGAFVFKSGTGDEADDGTGTLLILGSSTRTRFSYQFYTGTGSDGKQESGDLILSTSS